MIILCNQTKQANVAMNGKCIASFKVTSDLCYGEAVQGSLQQNSPVKAPNVCSYYPCFHPEKYNTLPGHTPVDLAMTCSISHKLLYC